MKTLSKYKQAKVRLKNITVESKTIFNNDKPKIRMLINDSVDYLSKDLNLSEYQRNLLSNYACSLHPKD